MAQQENGVSNGTHLIDLTTATTEQEMENNSDNTSIDMLDTNCITNDTHIVEKTSCHAEDAVLSFDNVEEKSTSSDGNQFIEGNTVENLVSEENQKNDDADNEVGITEVESEENAKIVGVTQENAAIFGITEVESQENAEIKIGDVLVSDCRSIDAISLTDIKASFLNNQEEGYGDNESCIIKDKNSEVSVTVSDIENTNTTNTYKPENVQDSSNSNVSSIDTNTHSDPPASPKITTDINEKPSDNDSAEILEFDPSENENIIISSYAIQPGELTDQLIEGPSITLPSSEISNLNSSSSQSSAAVTCDPPSSCEHQLDITSSTSAEPHDKNENFGSKSVMDPETSNQSQEATTTSIPSPSRPVSTNDSSSVTSASATTSGPQQSESSTTTNSSTTTTDSTTSAAVPAKRVKKTPHDFIFGKVLGEGSYSSVYLAKEVSTQREFAVKVCEKKFLIREKKTHFVMREKEVLMKLDHSFFIKLAYTFQDSERLYYVLTYARNGELLSYLNKLSVFDVPCTRFYSAEIVIALEYLQSLGIVHRDLKPENVLLGEDMHIKISDFGTSKFINGGPEVESQSQQGRLSKRKNSFVGTAEYVSPEVLNGQPANFGTDLWALACIIYQCLSSCLPFRSGNEYQTFQKILKLEYEFPEGFHEDAKDLVQKLLVLEPTERLGNKQQGGMAELKSHPFFQGIDWETLPNSTPPKLLPYLPASANNPEFWGEQDQRTGFDDQRLAEIITGQTDRSVSPELEPISVPGESESVETVRKEKLEKQRQDNQFHPFVENNLILRQGFVDKRKGFFARKRMLLLTEGPHLYYVDAHNKVLKGEIPWSKELRPEAKNFKIFFVHTPNRTYYLESRNPDAHHWVKRIQEVWSKYYGNDEDGSSNSNKDS